MISLNREELLPLREAPNFWPRRRGKKVHYSTIFRWAKKGLGGRKLETQKLGGVLYTSEAAIERFKRGSVPASTEETSTLRKALYGKPR